jgi:Trypsin-like peptidase domain
MDRAASHLLAIVLLWHLAEPSAGQTGMPNELIAMVRVTENGTVVSHGAAIVVHQSADRTVLVTAYHVLRERDGDWLGTPEVEFFDRRGSSYRANYNSAYVDKAFDLAVLFIDHTSNVRPPSLKQNLAQGVVSPDSENALLGAPVRVLGFMDTRPWSRTSTSDRITASDARRITIRSTAAEQGVSGGAVIDSLNRLVAMGLQIERGPEGPVLQALSMSTIRGRLAAWGLPFELRTSDAPSAGGAIEQRLRDGMRLEVTYAPVNASGSSPWPHLYRVVLPPDIAPLVTQVVIESLLLPSGRFIFNPPAFADTVAIEAVRLRLKQFVTLHDGRKFGPYETTVDLSAGPAAEARAKGPDAVKAFARTLEVVTKNSEQMDRQQAVVADGYQQEQRSYLQAQAAAITRNAKENYVRWRIRCGHIKEPTVNVWRCASETLPIGPGWPRNLPGDAVFEEVRLGDDPERVRTLVPLDEKEFGPKFLAHAATMLKDGAKELYVTVRLLDGSLLGPKQLCVVRGAGCF